MFRRFTQWAEYLLSDQKSIPASLYLSRWMVIWIDKLRSKLTLPSIRVELGGEVFSIAVNWGCKTSAFQYSRVKILYYYVKRWFLSCTKGSEYLTLCSIKLPFLNIDMLRISLKKESVWKIEFLCISTLGPSWPSQIIWFPSQMISWGHYCGIKIIVQPADRPTTGIVLQYERARIGLSHLNEIFRTILGDHKTIFKP